MNYFDEEEKQLIEWYEREFDNFIKVDEREINRLRAIFREDLDHQSVNYTEVSFPVNGHDLKLFKEKAKRMGISYKKLLALLVHRYTIEKKTDTNSK